MYRVRVLATEGEAAADGRDVGALVRQRLRTARDARRAIGIPNEDTDTYRFVSGTNRLNYTLVRTGRYDTYVCHF